MGQRFAAYDVQGTITAFYDSVDSPVPAGVIAIEITDAQWQTCLSTPGYTVQNGVLVAPGAPTLEQLLAAAQATQTALLSSACGAKIIAGVQSSALGTPYTYPTKQTDQTNMSSSVLDASLALSSQQWQANSVYAAGSIVNVNGVPMEAVTSGTSGTAAPAWPAQKETTVNDNGIQWKIWTTAFWCEDQTGKWAWIDHSAAEIVKAGRDVKAAILARQAQNATLQAEVAAITVNTPSPLAAVQAIVWPAS